MATFAALRSQASSLAVLFGSLRRHPLAGYENLLGIWVAPDAFVIAEFAFRKDVSPSVLWHEVCEYSERAELFIHLAEIAKKRWLKNRTIHAAICTADILTLSDGFDAGRPPEEQNLLPDGMTWDDLEYAVDTEQIPLVCCMRKTDVNKWGNEFLDAGLIMASLVPAGYMWPLFFNSPIVECTLPQGKFTVSTENKTLAAAYAPTIQKSEKTEIMRIDAVQNEANRWCPINALPALEPVLYARQKRNLNLMPNAFFSQKCLDAERNIWKGSRLAIICILSITAVLLFVSGALYFSRMALGEREKKMQNQMAQMESLKKEITKQRKSLEENNELMGQKSELARILYDIGKMAGQGLWYSEMRIDEAGAPTITLLGHSTSEKRITELFDILHEVHGVKNVAMEYSERLSAQQISRLTGGKKSMELFRFKMMLQF